MRAVAEHAGHGLLISFVVPAYNEARLLGPTLDAIHSAARAAGRPYEIVVADDASTDATPDIARARGARVVRCRHRQISRVRNAGARAASGDVLVFVDADTTVSAALVRASLAALERGAIGGGAMPVLEGRVAWWGRLIERVVIDTMRACRWAAGCYVFCRREAFERIGGFDERLFATEEIALSRAMKRLGRFVILRERVVTSGRKVRTHSPREFLHLIAGLLRYGPGLFTRRDRLGLWYGERRHE